MNMARVVQRVYVLVAVLAAESLLAVSDPYTCFTLARIYSDIVTLGPMLGS